LAPFSFSAPCSLFNSLETLFWAIFGLVDLDRMNLSVPHFVTEWAGKTMFGSYGVISLVVLLNMLIAMMSNSYEYIAVRSIILFKLTSRLSGLASQMLSCIYTQPFENYKMHLSLSNVG